MGSNIGKGSHTVGRLTCHVVWSTKYGYKVLHSDLQSGYPELLIQGCESHGIEISKGVASSDHIHMHIDYAPKLSVSTVVKSLKDRSSRKPQQEFPS